MANLLQDCRWNIINYCTTPERAEKMKKLSIASCALILILCFLGNANAISFTDATPLWKKLEGVGSLPWKHSTPDDFTVPHDTVNSAKLGIFLIGYDKETKEKTTIVGDWSLGVANNQLVFNGSWNDPFFASVFNIESVFSSWENAGDPLNIVLNYNTTSVGPYLLGLSVFNLNYDNVDPTNTLPTPEPGTIILLGTALLGASIFSRKKFKNIKS